MDKKLGKKLLQKEMDRKEFLQFSAGAIFILLGFGNLVALIKRFVEPEPAKPTVATTTQHGFGSRKFGV